MPSNLRKEPVAQARAVENDLYEAAHNNARENNINLRKLKKSQVIC